MFDRTHELVGCFGEDTLETELYLCGCLIKDPSLVNKLEGITARDFRYEVSQKLFETITALSTEGIEPTLGAVKNRYSVAGGDIAIARAMFAIPTDSFFETQCRVLRESTIRRNVSAAAYELYSAVYDGETISELEHLVGKCADAITEQADTEAKTLYEGWEKFAAHKADPPNYITTGWEYLDRQVNISPGDVVIIGGRPSSGKTAYSLEMAARLAEKYKVLYFSYETNCDKLTERTVTALARVNFSKVKRRSLEAHEAFRIDELGDTVQKMDLTFIQAAGRSVEWICRKALHAKADIIFVDYIGLVNTTGKDRYEIVTHTTMQLHTMAQRYKIAVVALSQLNRDAADGRPTMKHLRESGQIEQDADVILLLHKGAEEMKNGNPTGVYDLRVYVEKNKEGSTGVLRYRFIGYQQRFEEVISSG